MNKKNIEELKYAQSTCHKVKGMVQNQADADSIGLTQSSVLSMAYLLSAVMLENLDCYIHIYMPIKSRGSTETHWMNTAVESMVSNIKDPIW